MGAEDIFLYALAGIAFLCGLFIVSLPAIMLHILRDEFKPKKPSGQDKQP